GSKVLEVLLALAHQMVVQTVLKCSGQGHDAMLASFAVMDGDGALAEVYPASLRYAGTSDWASGKKGNWLEMSFTERSA
ncbi:MAG: hypothetical protein R3242_05850, partial [Akkermansiaceae bacterium]|nr:hypothetical protein [Akkermansiaceae bacterium]